MSANGQGNATEVVDFQELDVDSGDGSPTKAEQLMTFLSENLNAEALGKVREILGLSKDLSNTELLAEIRKELKKKEEEEEEEEEPKKAASYQDFMKSCMKEGKSLKECADEYKKEKKPEEEPTDAEIAEVERLASSDWKAEIEAAKKKEEEEEEDKYPEPIKKKMQELQDEINGLKELNRKAGIDNKIDLMLNEKHMTPKQAEEVRKLMYKLPDAEHGGILNIFRSQVITVQEDVGRLDAPTEIPLEQRKKLMKDHGLDRLMQEKGGRLPGVE